MTSTGSRKSVIDLVWSPPNLISKLSIPSDRLGLLSDHFPVLFTISLAAEIGSSFGKPTFVGWKWDTPGGLEKYRRAIQASSPLLALELSQICLDTNLDDQTIVNNMNSLITNYITTAASDSFGRRHIKPGAKAWWSSECTSAVKEYRKQRIALQKMKKRGTISLEGVTTLKKMRSKRRRTLRSHKSKPLSLAPYPENNDVRSQTFWKRW